MPAQSRALPRAVVATLVVLTVLLTTVATATPAPAAARRPAMQLRVAGNTLTAELSGFRGRSARVRLEIGKRTVVKHKRVSRHGRAVVRFWVDPRRPKVAEVTVRVGDVRRRRALQYTSRGVWVTSAAGTKTRTNNTTTSNNDPLPPSTATPQGPFGPDAGFAPTGGVSVAVGRLSQNLLDEHPEGTRFVLAAGVHRLTSRLRPRSGQQLLGMPGAVLDGSKAVTGFTSDGGLWVSGGHDYSFSTHGSCRSGYDACGRSEAVFLDGRPLWQVTSRAELAPGRFVFDRDTDQLVLYDNPAGKSVTLTVASAAVAGRRSDGSLANNVVVRNLVIRRFATMAQRGAVDSEGAAGWVVERNTIRQNSGAGVIADSHSIVRGNAINDNGQMGMGGHGTNGLVEGNEIARNHTNGFNIGWEAGGAKWSHTTGLVVRGNYVHHNDGPGLWTDIDNITTRYENNVVNSNSEAGIFHEISYDVVIAGNRVARNGFGNPRWGYGAGIQVAASPRATVTGNVVDSNARGITLIQQDRGDGDYGPYEISDTLVANNHVVMRTGFTGLVQDVGDTSYFTDRNNRFTGNTYVIAADVSKPFEWRNGTKSVSEWRSFHAADGPFSTP